VAVKVLASRLAGNPEAQARFEREAKAVAALSHPNVLALFGYGESDGTLFTVSELLEGETLRARLAAGSLSQRKAVEYAVQIAHGLAAAHERGIVHRDLKPENIFLTRDGQVKILDFGLARLTGSELETVTPDGPTLSRPGVVLGTAGYMSPEQVRGQSADRRTATRLSTARPGTGIRSSSSRRARNALNRARSLSPAPPTFWRSPAPESSRSLSAGAFTAAAT
jgi:eukaryotic-like serine/threonine-protein kinase